MKNYFSQLGYYSLDDKDSDNCLKSTFSNNLQKVTLMKQHGLNGDKTKYPVWCFINGFFEKATDYAQLKEYVYKIYTTKSVKKNMANRINYPSIAKWCIITAISLIFAWILYLHALNNRYMRIGNSKYFFDKWTETQFYYRDVPYKYGMNESMNDIHYRNTRFFTSAFISFGDIGNSLQ